MNYLVLLKDDGEAEDGWLGPIEGDSCGETLINASDACVILTESEKSAVISVDDELKQLIKSSSWIIIAYLGGEENADKNPEKQRRLKEYIGDINHRIFHHGGGLNVGATTTKNVRDKFRNAGFEEAGFSVDKLMNFSKDGHFPWDKDVKKVKELFANKSTNNSYKDALKHLNPAWDKAWAYFNIDKPIEKVLEGLFPLYIDANNLTKSTDQADWNAALSAAWSNLNRLLDELDSRDENQLLTTWKAIVAGVDNNAKPLINTVIALLDHCITALKITEEARTGVSDVGTERKRFIAMFNFLSDAYYSKRPEYLAPST